MKRESKDKMNVLIFIVLAVIVGAGWIYGLTSPDSEIVQAFKVAPWYMNVLGIVWFLGFGFVTYMFATEKWSIQSVKYSFVPVLIAIVLAIVGGILISANFYNGSY